MLRVLRARTVQMVSRDLLVPQALRVPLVAMGQTALSGQREQRGLLVLREPTGLPVLMGPRVPQGLPVLMGPRVLRDLPAIFPVWN